MPERLFDRDPEREWQRLVRAPLEEIKLHVHEHYLRAYLSAGMRVLEIGAGAGRFTKTLHEIGCRIVVGDVSTGQLRANRAKAAELGFDASVEQWLQIDICDMLELEARTFDAVVAYGGPLSYVFDRAGDALDECARLLKPNGRFLASVMSLWGTMHRHLPAIMALPVESNREIVRTGDLTPETAPASENFCHMFRADELRNLVEAHGFRVLAMSASNALSTTYGDLLDAIRKEPAAWHALLEWELEACASSGLVGSGTHMIVVAEKV